MAGPLPPAVAAAVAPVSLPQAEDFTDGLRVESATTYTVDLPNSVVHVAQVVTLTNETPDRTTQSAVQQFFFTSFGTPVLVGATHVAASRDGGPALSVSIQAGDGVAVSWAVVDLDPHLYYGRTQVLRITYDLPPQPPRTDTYSQVNRAFATFPVYSGADPGLGSVTVVVPAGLAVDVVGDELTRSSSGTNAAYSASAIADPGTWWTSVIIRDDNALVTQNVELGDAGIRLLGWPGDGEWLDFTADLARRGLPVLEDTIGLPWAAKGQLDLVETATPSLYGYAGWYQHSSEVIEVGDRLDAQTTLHELAHVWFNEEMFSARWIDEGLACEYSALAMAGLGMQAPVPDAVDPAVAGPVQLNDWSGDPTSGADGNEAYGYNTSWWVVHELVGEIGADSMAEVLAAASAHEFTYPATVDERRPSTVADWRAFLDLLEGVGGSVKAEEVFRAVVVAAADEALLDQRAQARDEYATVLDASDGWAPPAALREAMAAWRFDSATAMMPQVIDLFGRRDALAADLAQIDRELPAALQEQFELSVHLDQLATVLDDATGAADALVDAVDAQEHANPLARVGLLLDPVDDELAAAGKDLDAGSYAAAAQSAQDAERGVASATWKGGLGVGGLLVLLVVVGLVVGAVVRRRRSRVAAMPPLDQAPPGL